MNKHVHLVQEHAYEVGKFWYVKVDDEIQYLKQQLEYLDYSKQDILNHKGLPREFLDVCTYKNICTGIAGGLYYARDLLSFPEAQRPKSVALFGYEHKSSSKCILSNLPYKS
jgi:hypothetical protein